MIKLTRPSQLAPYLRDASNMPGGFAEGVVVPRNEKEVVEFLKESNVQGRPVTVAGHGSGLVGGRIPFGGWVLATERLNRIVSLKKVAGGAEVVVEPGVSLGKLREYVLRRGFFYGPDPTEADALIGGNINTNASGARSFKYGTTRAQVLGLRVALADGRLLILRRGRVHARDGILTLRPQRRDAIRLSLPDYRMPVVKHVAGYFSRPNLDAVDLFIGAEGTLGVVTQATLKLHPAPAGFVSFFTFFRSEEAAWRFAIRSRRLSRRKRGPLAACALEYMDSGSLRLLRRNYHHVPAGARAAIYVEQEADRTDGDRIASQWWQLIDRSGGGVGDLWLAFNERQRQALKSFRRALPLAVNAQRRKAGQPKVGTDMAVPDSRLVPMLRAYRRALDDLRLPYCVFGHIGDNHLHANIMPRTEKELEKARVAVVRLVRQAVAFGGTPSAEHGIGKLKRAYLRELYGPDEIEKMRQIKSALDPGWILGRGNIFEA